MAYHRSKPAKKKQRISIYHQQDHLFLSHDVSSRECAGDQIIILGRGSGKLRAALSVQLAWAFLLWGASPHTPLPACCACRARYPYKLGTSLKQQQQQQDAKFKSRPSSLINSKNTLALTSTKLGLCIPQFYNKSVLI